MREILHYNDAQIGISDEGPLGFTDGTYVVCAQGNAWAIYYSQGEMVVSGYAEHQNIPDKDRALDLAKKLIDLDHLQSLSDKGNFLALAPDQDPAKFEGLVVDTPRLFNAGDASIPLKLLLSLHNALPLESPVRAEVVAFIEQESTKDKGASWTMGICRVANGDLTFSQALFNTAMYRAKQETRAETIFDLFETLRRNLEMVKGHQAYEKFAASGIASEVGEPIVKLRESSPEVMRIREKMDALKSYLDQETKSTHLEAPLTKIRTTDAIQEGTPSC